MKSWKTTVGGILMAIGSPLAISGKGIYQTLGVIMQSVGGILMGFAARDNKVSSEEAGAK